MPVQTYTLPVPLILDHELASNDHALHHYTDALPEQLSERPP